MATATATKHPPTESSAPTKREEIARVCEALEAGEMPAAKLLEKVGERALNLAWTGGYVEFGHREFSVCGNPDNPVTQSQSELHVESGDNWTGPKKITHIALRELLARGVPIPTVAVYKFNRVGEKNYTPQADVSPLAKIDRSEAEKLLYLRVRLTDAGYQFANE